MENPPSIPEGELWKLYPTELIKESNTTAPCNQKISTKEVTEGEYDLKKKLSFIGPPKKISIMSLHSKSSHA